MIDPKSRYEKKKVHTEPTKLSFGKWNFESSVHTFTIGIWKVTISERISMDDKELVKVLERIESMNERPLAYVKRAIDEYYGGEVKVNLTPDRFII